MDGTVRDCILRLYLSAVVRDEACPVGVADLLAEDTRARRVYRSSIRATGFRCRSRKEWQTPCAGALEAGEILRAEGTEQMSEIGMNKIR